MIALGIFGAGIAIGAFAGLIALIWIIKTAL